MPAAAVDKVIVTNEGALKAKYGADYNAVLKPALADLIVKDKARGLTTVVVALDNATTMKRYKAKKVANAADPKENKAAIDGVFKALQPDYLCLLGAVDVVPHQDLLNPLASDGDRLAPGDLPYACDAAYSQKISDFLQPTRVVGRLPDVTGGKDAKYLAGLLQTAADAVSLPRSEYAEFLGISADVWKASTQLSLQNAFGDSSDLQDAPPSGPPWTGRIDRRAHFINCHGSPGDPRFYGQKGEEFPIAHDAAKLAGLRTGTVFAAECCYGAELYDPAKLAVHMSICNTYLAAGTHGYFGSSTIAYGPASGNGQADLICQFFLKHVLNGESVGEAALQARLDFIRVLSVADPADLKTLAQFNLMGDPSLHPVKADTTGHSVVVAKSAKSATGAEPERDPEETRAATRELRRAHLAALGQIIGSAVATIATTRPVAVVAEALLGAELKKMSAELLGMHSFSVNRPKVLGKALALGVDSIHAAVGELPKDNAPFRRLLVVIARQEGDQFTLRHLFSR